MQMNDGLADFLIRLGAGAGDHVRFDIGKQSAFGRLSGEIHRHVFDGNVIGHDALDGAHGAAGFGDALGDFFGIDAAVEYRRLPFEFAPAPAKDRFDFPLQLLGT